MTLSEIDETIFYLKMIKNFDRFLEIFNAFIKKNLILACSTKSANTRNRFERQVAKK